MTELARYDEPVPYLPADRAPAVPSPTVQNLADWAQSAQAAHQVAQNLVQTAFVPQAFRGKPMEATAAILAGAEVGLSPMSALRAFDVIQGTAAPRAITLRAVAQSRGHEFVLAESTATRCKVRARRYGSQEWQESVWTIDRARQLGLTGKDNWKNQPQAMLVARATAEAARLVAADAIMGLNGGYAIEEIDDGAAPPPTTAQRSTGPARTARRSLPAPVPDDPPLDEPSLDDIPTPPPTEQPDPDPQPETQGEPITSAQLKMLHARMNATGLGNRDDGLAFCTQETGRNITSTKDLTKAEASTLIDLLNDADGQS